MKPILSIDVGATKIAYALVTNKKQISRVLITPTLKKNLVAKIEEIINQHKNLISGIGIGMPGSVLDDGTVTGLGNIKNFPKINLKISLQKKFKLPVCVDNDANAFTLAESLYGAGKKYRNVVGIVLGTGIGTGIVLNKKILRGLNGLGGEYGHFILPDGQFFEHFARKAGPFKNIKTAAPYLKMLFNFIVRSVDPDCIVIGGSWKEILKNEKALRNLLPRQNNNRVKTTIKLAKLKYPNILGAVLSLLRHKT